MASVMQKYPSIEVLFADPGCARQAAQTVSQCHDIQVQVGRHPVNQEVGRWTHHPDQSDLFTVQADTNGVVVLAKR